jgi:hypothetical protein
MESLRIGFERTWNKDIRLVVDISLRWHGRSSDGSAGFSISAGWTIRGLSAEQALDEVGGCSAR